MQTSELIGCGDHPALDFVNSMARPVRVQWDLLTDGRGWLGWLRDTGLVSDDEARVIERTFSPTELDASAGQATEFREWLRPVIGRWVAGTDLVDLVGVAGRLNELLEHDSRYASIAPDGAALVEHRRWDRTEQLLAPVAAAAAELFTAGDRSLVRQCEAPRCPIWFYDRTKSHRRRWCSMAVCGNRAKARSHRERTAGTG